ncbi:PepSY domain-containing protein [Streptomyces sp. NPDC007988]|uniref:PepSY domain-containing protein n=1 Tax=Streptomyces sp. NPDC007988 TaxID=3364802 RepID=UPI0036E88184
MKRRKLAIATLTAAVLAGGGTAAAFAVQDGDGDGDRGDAAQARAAKVTVSQAIDTALGTTPGTVTGAGLDDAAWEVDIHGRDGARHDVTLDAATGKITSTERSDGDGPAPSAKDAPVTAVRAAEAAESAVPGTVTSVELDRADGSGDALVWEAEVQGLDGREHELTVDAKSAKVSTEARKAAGAESDGDADEHGDSGDHDGDDGDDDD